MQRAKIGLAHQSCDAMLAAGLAGFTQIEEDARRAVDAAAMASLSRQAVGCKRLLDSEPVTTVMLNSMSAMHNAFTAVFERDGEWVIAYRPDIPGAKGQGRTKEVARTSLAEAIALILEDRREGGLRGVPPDAERETVTVR